jgi:hypothetical protein
MEVMGLLISRYEKSSQLNNQTDAIASPCESQTTNVEKRSGESTRLEGDAEEP